MTELILSENVGKFFNVSLFDTDGMYVILGKCLNNGALEYVELISHSCTVVDRKPSYQQVSCRLRVQYRIGGLCTDLVDVGVRNGIEEYTIQYLASHVLVNGDFTIVFTDDSTRKKLSDPNNLVDIREASNE